MRAARAGAAALAVAVSVLSLPALGETPEEEIDRCLAGLAADDPAQREAASELLEEIGPEALGRFDPARHGRDPDVRDAVRRRMDGWGYVALADLGLAPRQGWRLAPWERVEDVPEGHRSGLDDDRLRPWLLSLAAGDPGALAQLLYRDDWPLEADLVRSALERDPRAAARFLAFRRTLPPEVRALPELGERLKGELSGPEAAQAARLLALSGREREALAAAARERRIPPRSLAEYPADGEGRGALLDAAEAGWGREACAAVIDAPRYLDLYIERADLTRICRLPPAHAVPALRLLLGRAPGVRVRAAAILAALGEPSGGTGDFDDPAAGLGGLDDDRHPLAEIRIGLSRIADRRAPVRLRTLIRRRPARTDLLLDLLSRFGRDKDVTFAYETLKEDPSPAGAVALARLGSAAGIPLLLPELASPVPGRRAAAFGALCTIRGDAGGYDPSAPLADRFRAIRAWRRWWADNKSSFRPAVR